MTRPDTELAVRTERGLRTTSAYQSAEAQVRSNVAIRLYRLWLGLIGVGDSAPLGRKLRRQRALARSRRQRRGAKRDRSGSLG